MSLEDLWDEKSEQAGEWYDEHIGDPLKETYDEWVYDSEAGEDENPYGWLQPGSRESWYKAQQKRTWSEYKDLDSKEFIGMSDAEKLEYARKLTGDPSLTMGDLDKYFPEYDTREEKTLYRDIDKLRRHSTADLLQGAEDVRDIQLGQRGNLLEMSLQQDSAKARSGFHTTGNPMIDRQRQNIYSDISRGVDTSFRKTQQRALDFEHDVLDTRQDIYQLRDDFLETWAERAISYEDKMEAEEAADDASDDGGGCCFIVLEASEGTQLDKYVRQYRDMACTDTNRKGYYKLAQVVVPFMRKSKLAKWFFKYSFVAPAKSYAKWYYTGKGIGWIFEPLRKFWLNTFDYLGRKHKLKRDE